MKQFRLAALGLAAAAAMFVAPSVALADCETGNCWGAVAFGPRGAWAYSVNEPSREAAEKSALGQCSGCERVLTFHNSCGAYASGDDGYGWGNAGSREDAEARALEECEKHAGNCKIRVWGCTAR